MDARTGEIYSPEEIRKMYAKDPEQAKDLVEIPPGELSEVEGMNRHERRKWAAERRKKK